MNDIFEYTDNNNIEAILFFGDFEKAFDFVDQTFSLLWPGFYG